MQFLIDWELDPIDAFMFNKDYNTEAGLVKMELISTT